jgi:hypothetical protein
MQLQKQLRPLCSQILKYNSKMRPLCSQKHNLATIGADIGNPICDHYALILIISETKL